MAYGKMNLYSLINLRVKDTEKVDRIYTATVDLCFAEGLGNLTIAKIARASSMAAGTVYIYFTSKEHLFNSLFQVLKRKASSVQTVLREEDDLVDQLRKLWVSVFDYRIQHHREVYFMQQFVSSPFMADESKALSNEFRYAVESLLDQGRKTGVVADISNNVLFAILSGSMHQLTELFLAQPETFGVAFSSSSFDYVWPAIKKQ